MHRRFVPVGSWCLSLLAMLAGASAVNAAAPVYVSAVSRMAHGASGNFDIQLPLSGNSGIECRSTTAGMTFVFTYDQAITSTATPTLVTVPVSTATLGVKTISGSTVSVTITGIQSTCTSMTVTVPTVKNAANQTLATSAATCRILLGDVSASGVVNSSDVNICRAAVATGNPVDGSNFRSDLNINGVLTAADLNVIRTQAAVGTTANPAGATPNTPPTISAVTDINALTGQATPVNVTVGDAESDPSTLAVVATSSDQGVIPLSNIVVSGTGTARTINITPVVGSLATNVVNITLTASDGLLSSSTVSFNVTVTPAPTIFLATLAPINGVLSLGSGTATLVVSGDQTHANLRYSFSNLAGTDSDDQIFSPGDVGIFDVPTFAFYSSHLQLDGSLLWTFPANKAASILSTLFSNTAYMTISTSKNPTGELRGTFQKVVGSQVFSPPAPAPAITIDPPSPADASRFLQQAAFGGTYSEITALSDPNAANASTALESWMSDQFATTPPIVPNVAGTVPAYRSTVNTSQPPAPALNVLGCTFSSSSWFGNFWFSTQQPQPEMGGTPGVLTSGPGDHDDNGISTRNWWKNAVTSPDQLRQKVVTAYSEFFVISQQESVINYELPGLCTYWDMLGGDAFGNFRTILEDVTLHPAMGEYLTMAGNNAPNGVTPASYAPNENYAREIMQLFSIGLYMLQPDGTLMLDANGQPIPTYSQSNVTNLAHVFTGWNNNNLSNTIRLLGSGGAQTNQSIHWLTPMIPTGNAHSTVSKSLLNYPGAATFPGAGQPAFIPANTAQTVAQANQEMAFALDNIFNHPNVGPFFCKQMIQRLVTSNPSPGYVYRVSQVFADDGTAQHVRGNLQKVLQAIFTDYEARSPVVRKDPGFGKPREPMIRVANILRSLQAKSNTGNYWVGGTDNLLAQTPMNSPTVFNFFAPDYQQPGPLQAAGLVAPEFNIIYATTIVQAQNMIYSGIYAHYNADGTPTFPGYVGPPGQGSMGTSGGFVDGGAYPFTYPAGEVVIDFSTNSGNGLLALAGSSTSSLVDRVGLLLLACDPPGGANQMDPAMKTAILNYINSAANAPAAIDKAKAAVHLVATSAQASLQK